MMRALVRAVATAGIALAGLWLTPLPASAHGTVNVTIHSDGAGSVWTTLAWSDGHPVSEPATAIMIATSTDGRRVGPVGLRAVAGTPGTLAYASRLETGQWRLTVDAATPGLGHCEADVTIGASPAAPGPPAETTCAAPTPAPVAARPPPSSAGPWLTLLVVAGVALTAAAVAWRTRRPRRRRAP